MMTTAEFRRDGFLVSTVREFQETETFTFVLEALTSDGPLKRKEVGNAERILGRVEGYEECLDRLRSLGVYQAHVRIENEQVTDLEEQEEKG